MEEFTQNETRRNGTEDVINTDTCKMSELEFKSTTIRLLAGVANSTEDTRGTLSAEIKELKTSQAKIKTPIPRCNQEWLS